MSERIENIKAAVEKRIGGIARHVRSTPVTLKEPVTWEGIVETFDLDLNPKVKRAYGLMYREGDQMRYETIPGTDEINSPEVAVRELIASQIKHE